MILFSNKKTKVISTFFLAISLSSLPPTALSAQNLDSTNYRLIQPAQDSISGINSSTNYEVLNSSSPLSTFTTTSTNYRNKHGINSFIEASVPSISCFETSTNGGSTVCTGTPQTSGNGMQSVCSTPGCYDRAKLEINIQNNPADTQYAIQISTTSDFSSNVYYVNGTTRTLDSSLALSNFLFKCEWEGTILAGYCGSANTTWQKFDVLGLNAGTTYYARVSALHGSDTDGNFTQSPWGPSASVATQHTSISIDVDIASGTGGSSTPPYQWTIPDLVPNVISTSTNYAIFRVTTNAMNGMQVLIKGTNGGLKKTTTSDLISNVNGDLASLSSGFGLRNDLTTNSQVTNAYLGTITVSSSPSDFTDTGATEKVGSPTTSFVKLFSSNNLPLLTGVSAYKAKAKPAYSHPAGSYQEILTFVVTGVY